MRNEKRELNDIKFEFLPDRDSPDGIAGELVGAGLVHPKDQLAGMTVFYRNLLQFVLINSHMHACTDLHARTHTRTYTRAGTCTRAYTLTHIHKHLVPDPHRGTKGTCLGPRGAPLSLIVFY